MNNTVAGYAVALPDHRNAAGRAIWYSGTRLDRNLTLGQLRRRWMIKSEITDRIC